MIRPILLIIYGLSIIPVSGGKQAKNVLELAGSSKKYAGNIKIIKYDDIQLQQKFKHAKDFGITGNYNSQNRELFKIALNKHVVSKGIQVKKGTYKVNY